MYARIPCWPYRSAFFLASRTISSATWRSRSSSVTLLETEVPTEVRTRLDTTEDSDEDMDLGMDESTQAEVVYKFAESGDFLKSTYRPDPFRSHYIFATSENTRERMCLCHL